MLLVCPPTLARQSPALVELINAYRASPGRCDGRLAQPAPPLVAGARLDRVQVAPGTFLEQALEQAGYPVARADAIFVSGPQDAAAVMAAITPRSCRALLGAQFAAVGVSRAGEGWLIVLAQPAPPSRLAQLPGWREAGAAMLAAVNGARAQARLCGEDAFGAAPALGWSDALAEAALAHSRDMAAQRYFSHTGKDGRVVGERALQAGYRWRRIGENIAAGQESADEVVAAWLTSPGHCANIMNPGFSEMGAAFALDPARQTPRVYWTEVFGNPR